MSALGKSALLSLRVFQGTSAVISRCAPGLLGQHHNLLLFLPSVSSVVTIGQTGVPFSSFDFYG